MEREKKTRIFGRNIFSTYLLYEIRWMWMKHWCKSYIYTVSGYHSDDENKEEERQHQKPMSLSTFSAFQLRTLVIFFLLFFSSSFAEFYFFYRLCKVFQSHNTKKRSDNVQVSPPKNILLLRSWTELRSSSKKFKEINCKGERKVRDCVWEKCTSIDIHTEMEHNDIIFYFALHTGNVDGSVISCALFVWQIFFFYNRLEHAAKKGV